MFLFAVQLRDLDRMLPLSSECQRALLVVCLSGLCSCERIIKCNMLQAGGWSKSPVSHHQFYHWEIKTFCTSSSPVLCQIMCSLIIKRMFPRHTPVSSVLCASLVSYEFNFSTGVQRQNRRADESTPSRDQAEFPQGGVSASTVSQWLTHFQQTMVTVKVLLLYDPQSNSKDILQFTQMWIGSTKTIIQWSYTTSHSNGGIFASKRNLKSNLNHILLVQLVLQNIKSMNSHSVL